MRFFTKIFLLQFIFFFFYSCSVEDDILSGNKNDAETSLNLFWDSYDSYVDNNFDSAIFYMKEVNSLAASEDKPEWLAASYMAMGQLQYKKGILGDATYNFLHAIELYKNLEDLNSLANAYNQLAWIYDFVDDPTTAIEYSILAKDIFVYEGNSYDQANIYRNLALYYNKLDQFSEAEKYLQLSEDVAKDARDNKTLAQIYNTSGTLYFKQLNYQSAREYYRMSIVNSDSSADGLWTKAAAMNNIFESYFYENDYSQAEEWLKKTLQLKKQLNDVVFLQTTLNLYAEMLIQQGKYMEAVDILQENLKRMDLSTINNATDKGLSLTRKALSRIADKSLPDGDYYLASMAIYNDQLSLYEPNSQALREKLETLRQQQAVQANVIKYSKNEEIERTARTNMKIIIISLSLLVCSIIALWVVIRKNKRYKEVYSKVENVLNNSKILGHLK